MTIKDEPYRQFQPEPHMPGHVPDVQVNPGNHEAWEELDKMHTSMLKLCSYAGHTHDEAATIAGGLITTVRYLVRELRL